MLYLISGLGADERLFKNLRLDVETRYIPWLKPLKKESFRAYCERMAESIDEREVVVLAGVSFGGMVAQEIAKFLKVEQIFAISTIVSPDEFSGSFKFLKATRVDKIVPAQLAKEMESVAEFFIEPESEEATRLVKIFLKELDLDYFNWSVDQILEWKNDKPFKNLVRIHGSRDRIFPLKDLKLTENLHVVECGAHFMTFDKAEEVGRVMNENLKK
ncbi:MAG TPA: alpha/beta hydrolase [Patescibacteria group bacterium]|nr:alpha/beta hydrolase [Patescibacteria group bacterium]